MSIITKTDVVPNLEIQTVADSSPCLALQTEVLDRFYQTISVRDTEQALDALLWEWNMSGLERNRARLAAQERKYQAWFQEVQKALALMSETQRVRFMAEVGPHFRPGSFRTLSNRVSSDAIADKATNEDGLQEEAA